MPAPRLSQAAELENANAAQAFNEKKWVWVPDEKEGYLSGWVNSEDGEVAEVVLPDANEIRRVGLDMLNKMNPPKFDRVEDIADLTFLNEASVVHNLRLRYGSGAIYTYSGLFLVAINPYQDLKLYTDKIIQQYRSKRSDENPPHIFAVAERAWVNMGDERENQSILITGESGAGKTESTKKVIQYLAAIATDSHAVSHSRSPTITHSNSFSAMPAIGLPRNASFKPGLTSSPSMSSMTPSSSSGFAKHRTRLGLLERQILQANPILEAFGNAQTQRNNNSSRFGKFVRIMFAPDASIAGASIDWYLLEKSRVVRRAEAERSFHIFYQLLAGPTGGNEKEREMDKEKQALKESLLLGGTPEDYGYLNQTRREVDGVDDRIEWNALKGALDTVGFTPTEQLDLFRIIAAILHIGNIQMTSSRSDDAASIANPSQVEVVCHLLGLPPSAFSQAVLRPQVRAGREWVTQARTASQSLDELSALCKTLYEKSFGALVERINQALDRPSSKSTFIGVLDIAGFEIFQVNGYEQLLINYTNEKLQQFFNQHMFVLEQEEYKREGIQWEYVNFGLNLQPTIDLIESTGTNNTSTVGPRNGNTLLNGSTGQGIEGAIGILSCLDEECIMPKATDLTFTNKLHSFWPPSDSNDRYVPSRFSDEGFVVRHYAAAVEYRTDGWLEKNKDPLNDNLTRVLAASGERYVSTLFAEYADIAPPPGPAGKDAPNAFASLAKKRGTKKGAFRTVAQRHKEQLASLMSQLQATQPHFVRCIVPNSLKKPGRIDVLLVLDQLRCNGVLEGIRIARMGYPNRLPFIEFRQRYEVLTPGIIPRGYMDGREACRRIVRALELDDALFKLGTSKIFFKAGVLAELEERRDILLYDLFSRLQAVARKWTARRQIKKVLNRSIAIRTIQRNARVYNTLRDWPWWQLYTKVRPLLAATRNDDELRQKEAELILIKERAERDKQEREALESLKMSLEAEKRKVEDQLEAERVLAVDKDTLLARAIKREAELEDEVAELQNDIDALDSQLTRAMGLQKESERKYNELRQVFDQASEHLVRMESGQKQWVVKEEEMAQRLRLTEDEINTLKNEIESLQKVGDELKNLAMQRQEDLVRTKDRAGVQVKELEGKLKVEIQNKEMIKDKIDSLEDEARHAKAQLAELNRTTTEYSSMIGKKDERIATLLEQLETSRTEHSAATKEILGLQSDIDTLVAELEAQKEDSSAASIARSKLQTELDELRTVLAAKSSEETRRNEAEKSKEVELLDLRSQSHKLQQDLADARKSLLELQGKLKKEVDQGRRELAALNEDHVSAVSREKASQAELLKAKGTLAELEKNKRSIESELQSIRTKQHESESELAELVKAKESSERQLATAQAKYHSIEDLMLQLERDKAASDRQLDASRKRLEDESAQRIKLERSVSNYKTELSKAKSRNEELDRALNQALTDLKHREWDVKQLESRQDKTIVEHVHVLEEAKRVTDRELAKAQEELQQQKAHIDSLQKARMRLKGENEDIEREKELERLELRTMEKAARAHQDRVSKAIADAEIERHAKDVAELDARRAQNALRTAKQDIEDLEQRLAAAQQSKANLESELDRIADETHSPNSMAKLQRQYEARIAELEDDLNNQESSNILARRLKERVDRQHAEIRQLVMNSGPKDTNFQSRLLQELQALDDALESELPSRSNHRRVSTNQFHTLSSTSPSKSHPDSKAKPAGSGSEKQVAALKQQVEFLELRIAASDRVRKHLESSIQEITSDLENSDGSKLSLQNYRSRLSKENARLKELLAMEAETRRGDVNQIDGVKAMWAKFQDTISEERKSYSRLEESRKALLVQQRTAQSEVDSYRAQVNELAQSKKTLQNEVISLSDQLTAAKSEASSAKRQLQTRLQEEQLSTSVSSAANSELQTVIATYQAKEQSYQERLEAAEIARAKAARAEASVRRSLAELEKANKDSLGDHKSIQGRYSAAEKQVRELEAKLQQESAETAQLALLNQRLAEELEDAKNEHHKDVEELDFKGDQTRKKYQTELASLSEELQSQRDTITRLREDNRKVRSDYDELQLTYNDEVYKYNESGAKKEKERLETKISDLTRAFESSSAAQGEQQTQIVSLHSQVRELRGALDDVEADRALLQKARRALQAELEGIKLDHIDTSKMSSDREFQVLHLEKQDLTRALEEQEDRITNAFDRMKKAESYANTVAQELGKIRVDNSELDRLNANLEKQIKELNVKIIDLETKSYANSPRATLSRRKDSRIEEITSQLQTKGASSRSSVLNPADLERHRLKFEEERKQYDGQITSLRQELATLQNEESSQQSARRKAERLLTEARANAASLQSELERLRGRLPVSGFGSPGNSPRK